MSKKTYVPKNLLLDAQAVNRRNPTLTVTVKRRSDIPARPYAPKRPLYTVAVYTHQVLIASALLPYAAAAAYILGLFDLSLLTTPTPPVVPAPDAQPATTNPPTEVVYAPI